MTNPFVADASVAIGWVHPAQATKQTVAMLDAIANGATLEVPALWPLEITNALLVLVRRRKLTDDERQTALGWLRGLRLRVDHEMAALAFSRLSEMELQSKKSSLVLEMCQRLQPDVYLFGAQGRTYADEAAFHDAGIRLEFQDYLHPTYRQQHGPFVSHLSVIDLLFNHGPDSLEIIMSGNLSKKQLIERHVAFERA